MTHPKEAIDLLSPSQIEEFRTYFKMFDKGGKGFIYVNQIGQVLKAMGQPYEEKNLKELIDVDSDEESEGEYGEIDFREFLDLVSQIVVHELDEEDAFFEEMKEAFRMYDKEENGYINVSDLRDIFRALDETTTEEELDELIAEIDTDSSGTIDFDDFMDIMTSHNEEDSGDEGSKISQQNESEM